MKYEQELPQYNSFTLMFIDRPYAVGLNLPASESNWYKVPTLSIPGSAPIYKNVRLGYISYITIDPNRTIIKMIGGRALVDKQILPPTYQRICERAVELTPTPSRTMLDTDLVQAELDRLGWNSDEYHKHWQTGQPYATPSKHHVELYATFRDIAVKACPSLEK